MTSGTLATSTRPTIPTASDAILETHGIEKIYQTSGGGFMLPALRGVDLSIERGELVAIMGPSGCGKSTLLHMLGGLDRPTSGEVWLDGQRIDTLNESKRAILRRQRIGFVFQFFNLINNLNVSDNVELPARLIGTSRADARRRREELLEDLGIADKAAENPARLSGGQRQRVALARALVNRPAVLLADEPTGNLDSESTQEVLSLLRRYHEAGQTIVLVTHDPEVARIASRLVTMRDGQIVADRPIASLVEPVRVEG
jgi:putative ABC transport system ATP-binding protein